jgi:multisubunit Na+/H+ antiporter MnhG subunit
MNTVVLDAATAVLVCAGAVVALAGMVAVWFDDRESVRRWHGRIIAVCGGAVLVAIAVALYELRRLQGEAQGGAGGHAPSSGEMRK